MYVRRSDAERATVAVSEIGAVEKFVSAFARKPGLTGRGASTLPIV
jgi:hypothetical protein